MKPSDLRPVREDHSVLRSQGRTKASLVQWEVSAELADGGIVAVSSKNLLKCWANS